MHPERDLNRKPAARPSGPELKPIEPVKSPSETIYPTPTTGRFADPPPITERPQKSHFDGWPSVLSTLALFLLAPLIAISIAAFVIQSYQVDGQSMETALQNDDRLIVDKWPRTWSRITHNAYVPKRGNIIIFNQTGLDFAGGGSKQLIKRVVGLPGERVVVNDGRIVIYNKEHPGGYDPDKSGIYQIAAPVTPGNVDLTLKNDEIFVSGDNRTNSEDSRYFGPVRLNQIVGKLAFRIIPVNKAQRF
jgi:signal peptidase I